MVRRAKIIVTLGPSSSNGRVILRLLKAGADLVRLNLSHGSHETHRQLVQEVRRQAQSIDRLVPLIFDLMGPRYRIGEVPEGMRSLPTRSLVRLGSPDSGAEVPVDDRNLLTPLKIGDRVLIDNGLVELKVIETDSSGVEARVVTGGTISTRKGINLPDSDMPFEISAKDRDDIRLAVELGVDFIAASYVGRAADVKAIRKEVVRAGDELPIIAKLERGRAIENIDEIADVADAVMVARGDLGVEVPLHRVPVLQKQIVAAGRRTGTPVIVATQMLDSMMTQPRPTRAEASDVASAVFDGVDALLLTGETAAGKYPIKAVQMMSKIIVESEAYGASTSDDTLASSHRGETNLPPLKIKPKGPGTPEVSQNQSEIADAVARAAVVTVQHLRVRQIVAFSRSGFTARLISRYRPNIPILAFTPDPKVARSVQMYWGVRPILISDKVKHHQDVVNLVERHLVELSLAKPGQNLVILMAEPLHIRSLTNLMRIQRVR